MGVAVLNPYRPWQRTMTFRGGLKAGVNRTGESMRRLISFEYRRGSSLGSEGGGDDDDDDEGRDDEDEEDDEGVCR